MTALAPRPRSSGAPAEVLVDAALDGDERAWAQLCSRHIGAIRAVAITRLRDEHAAEDVVQETLLRAWTRLHQLDDPHRLGPWLKTIAANVAIDHVRRGRPLAPLEAASGVACAEPSPVEHALRDEEARVLHGHLDALRDVDREALWQRDAMGVSVPELADELGMTQGSVRVLLSRARTKVRGSYGLLVAPLVALAARQRARFVGLGEAVPVALVAPALVAVVVGVVATAPSEGTDAAGGEIVDIAPDPDPVQVTDAVEQPPLRPRSVPAIDAGDPPVADGAPATPSASTSAPEAAPEQRNDGPGVGTGERRVGFRDGAPTEEEPEVTADAPVLSDVGVDIYLEDERLRDACVVC